MEGRIDVVNKVSNDGDISSGGGGGGGGGGCRSLEIGKKDRGYLTHNLT